MHSYMLTASFPILQLALYGNSRDSPAQTRVRIYTKLDELAISRETRFPRPSKGKRGVERGSKSPLLLGLKVKSPLPRFILGKEKE